jgi:HAD superfamily hydrolase (TIGR01509 family)
MTRNGSVSAIVFDIGRVLVSIDVPRCVRHLAALAGVGEFESEFALFGGHYRRFARGEIDGPAFHAEVCKRLEREIPYERFTAAWCDMFDESPGMESIVAAVSHRFPIYLCSNTDPLHYAHLRATNPLLSYAAGAILSYEVGSEKPEAKIYETLMSRFSLPHGSALFIDDREENVTGASEHGLVGMLFESAEDLRADLVEMGVLTA